MVVVRCPGCAARYRVPEKLRGKKVKCKKCGDPFRIAPPPAEPEPDGDEDLLGALADGEVQVASPPPPPPPPDAFTAFPGTESASSITSETEPEQPAGGMASYLRDVGKSLLFFTHGGDLVTFAIVLFLVSLEIPLNAAGCLGLIGIIIISGWYMAFQLNVVLGAAGGETNLPNLTLGDAWEGIILPLVKWLLSWTAALVPFVIGLIYLVMFDQMSAGAAARHFGTALLGDCFAAFDPDQGGGPLLGSIFLVAMACWPMMLLVVAVGGVPSLVRIDLMVLTAIKTLPAYVLVMVLSYVGVVGPAALLMWKLSDADVGELLSAAVLGPGILISAFGVYANILTMRVIGLYYHHFKHRFAWSWG